MTEDKYDAKLKRNEDFEIWIEKMQDRGYTIYKDGKCPECSERAVVMHASSVCHGKCSNCNWTSTGFGGPNVHSWGEAVRRTYGAEGARIVAREKAAGRY